MGRELLRQGRNADYIEPEAGCGGVNILVEQDRDSIVGLRETVSIGDEPYIVAVIEPDPDTAYLLGRLGRDGRAVLVPSRVRVTLERFDGYPA